MKTIHLAVPWEKRDEDDPDIVESELGYFVIEFAIPDDCYMTLEMPDGVN